MPTDQMAAVAKKSQQKESNFCLSGGRSPGEKPLL